MGYFIVYLFGIKSIAIELFHAKSHRALLYVKRITRLKLPILFNLSIIISILSLCGSPKTEASAST